MRKEKIKGRGRNKKTQAVEKWAYNMGAKRLVTMRQFRGVTRGENRLAGAMGLARCRHCK